MVHTHPVYDTDKHFIIDPITRSVTNAESKKTTLIQRDHNSERFSFEVDKEIEGHDLTLCNEVEIHFSNVDSSKRNTSLGVYAVDDLVASEDGSKVVFTWLVSENATLYSGSLTFIITFKCVENGVVTYRWNTALNNSISIARGMQNGEEIAETYPDILSQWKMELFASVYGFKTMHIGPEEPDVYPYIWFDTSESNDPGVGIITVKDEDGRVQTVSTMVSMAAIDGLDEALKAIADGKAPIDHTHTAADIGAAPSDHTHTAEDVGAAPSDHTHTAEDVGAIPASEKGEELGVATLDSFGVVSPEQASSYVKSISSNHTLALGEWGDAGRTLIVESSEDIVITVPSQNEVNFPVGTEIEIVQLGTGSVTIVGTGIVGEEPGSIIYSLDGLNTISGQYGVVCLKKISTFDFWLLAGALV